jgi:hypothetical protein
MVDAVLDPFHRALKFALDEQITNIVEALASGSAKPIGEETSSVAEKYSFQVGQIQAYRSVLELCALIEKNMLDIGVRPAQVKVVER